MRGPLAALTQATRANRGMTLCLALSYGGRESIVAGRAAAGASGRRGRACARRRSARRASARALDTRALPPPDLMIRTSGEQRLSNFLLWEAAYAELYFTDVMWPDFGRDELLAALAAFSRRQRRFGRVDRVGRLAHLCQPARPMTSTGDGARLRFSGTCAGNREGGATTSWTGVASRWAAARSGAAR